jgi:hypothetical protein
MKRFVWLFILPLFGISGCATHYYSIKEDALYLYLLKPEARNVSFACSLDAFRLHGAQKIDGKTWEVRLPADREFKYFYLVDGAVFSPSCRFMETDDFGSTNCIFVPDM